MPGLESDVGKPDGAQSEGRILSGSCVLCSGQTYGTDVPCSMSMITEHFYDKATENAMNGIEWTQRKEGLQPLFEMKS